MVPQEGSFNFYQKKYLRKKVVFTESSFFHITSKLRHIRITKLEKLKEVLRSKYVQSYIEYSYLDVKRRLEEGEIILYSGTPCQIIGLKSFLGKQYASLYTIDFKCHGVPSPFVFREMLELYEKKMKSKVTNCTFREKDNGWRNQVTKIYFDNGKVIKYKSKFHFFYNMFLNNYILRKSCYDCKSCISHESDITLSDGWDIPDNEKSDLGISKIFINTSQGEMLFDEIKKYIKCEELEMNEIEYQKYFHFYKIKGRERFFSRLKDSKNYSRLFTLYNVKCLANRLINKIFLLMKVFSK